MTNVDPNINTSADPALAALLNDLARADAGTARPGLEARLFAATMPAAESATLRLVSNPEAPTVRVRRSFFTASRIAAALLLAGGLFAILLARPTSTHTSTPTTETLASTAEELDLALKSAEPDNLATLSDDLELLAKDAESLPTIADRDWTTGLLTEGTM
jgi:hypothetical protein